MWWTAAYAYWNILMTEFWTEGRLQHVRLFHIGIHKSEHLHLPPPIFCRPNARLESPVPHGGFARLLCGCHWSSETMHHPNPEKLNRVTGPGLHPGGCTESHIIHDQQSFLPADHIVVWTTHGIRQPHGQASVTVSKKHTVAPLWPRGGVLIFLPFFYEAGISRFWDQKKAKTK